jgi:hypothetical protein
MFPCGNPQERKKEEFQGLMETCCLGTPFPRSALFLYTSCRKGLFCTRVLEDLGVK